MPWPRPTRLPYGLAAYAFTASLSRASQLMDTVEAGMLALNHCVISSPETPFGGVKESGYSYEGSAEGLEALSAVEIRHLYGGGACQSPAAVTRQVEIADIIRDQQGPSGPIATPTGRP